MKRTEADLQATDNAILEHTAVMLAIMMHQELRARRHESRLRKHARARPPLRSKKCGWVDDTQVLYRVTLATAAWRRAGVESMPDEEPVWLPPSILSYEVADN